MLCLCRNPAAAPQMRSDRRTQLRLTGRSRGFAQGGAGLAARRPRQGAVPLRRREQRLPGAPVPVRDRDGPPRRWRCASVRRRLTRRARPAERRLARVAAVGHRRDHTLSPRGQRDRRLRPLVRLRRLHPAGNKRAAADGGPHVAVGVEHVVRLRDAPAGQAV